MTDQPIVFNLNTDGLRNTLVRGYLIEESLQNFLNERCDCAFMSPSNVLGQFWLLSTGGDDNGCHLVDKPVDFATMLDIALKRRKEP